MTRVAIRWIALFGFIILQDRGVQSMAKTKAVETIYLLVQVHFSLMSRGVKSSNLLFR